MFSLTGNYIMKTIFIIWVALFILGSCNTTPKIYFQESIQNKTIALQPLEQYNESDLETLKKQISQEFKTKVVILKNVQIPPGFKLPFLDDPNLNGYYGDSIINFLSHMTNDSITEVIGITRMKIYNYKEVVIKLNNKDRTVSHLSQIFGLGYVPGKACVISDIRLVSLNRELFNNRLRKVVFHELGHNLGLTHCGNEDCIMSETNGDIANLNKPGGDFCESCKKKLK